MSVRTPRAAQHVASGAFIAVCLRLVPHAAALGALLGFLALYAVLAVIRVAVPRVNGAYVRAFRDILRSHEVAPAAVPGAAWFVAGTAVCVAALPPGIALLAVGFLSVGDPAASYCGARAQACDAP